MLIAAPNGRPNATAEVTRAESHLGTRITSLTRSQHLASAEELSKVLERQRPSCEGRPSQRTWPRGPPALGYHVRSAIPSALAHRGRRSQVDVRRRSAKNQQPPASGASDARVAAGGHEPPWECIRCSRRQAHGRCGVRRCPVAARLGPEAAVLEALARRASLWRGP